MPNINFSFNKWPALAEFTFTANTNIVEGYKYEFCIRCRVINVYEIDGFPVDYPNFIIEQLPLDCSNELTIIDPPIIPAKINYAPFGSEV